MGQKIVLSGVNFTKAGLPVLRDDPILTPGSLFLFDPSHSLGAFTGLPTGANVVPNVAWEYAATAIGSGTQSSLAATAATTGNVAGKFLAERTVKGGLHGIVTQGGTQGADHNFLLTLPTSIRDFLYNNRTGHSFYISLWSKITRAALANAAPQSPFHFLGANTANLLFHFQNGTVNNGAGSNIVASNDVPTTLDTSIASGTMRFNSGAVLGVYGTGPSAANNVFLGVGTFGPYGSLNWNKGASRILYRAYIEDLTVSGRTHAQVNAIDYALYQAAFASGGRFNGDTYTDPATLP